MTATELVLLSAGAAGMGALFISMLRGSITKLFEWLQSQVTDRLTLSVTFTQLDPGFNMLREWLAAHPYANSAQRIKLVWNPEISRFMYVPGPGTHYLWYKKRPLVIRYNHKDSSNSWDRGMESYKLTVFGRDRKRLENLVDEISMFRKVEQSDHIVVYTRVQGVWNLTRKRKRQMDTVYMADSKKAEVLQYIDQFIKNETWYHIRGIPHRMGISFEGPPGSGKTTFATAIAAHFDRPVYLLNLSTLGSDDALMQAFLNVERDGIILIEDIDSYAVAMKRAEGSPEDTPSASPSDEPTTTLSKEPKEKQFGVTLSGLLNAIDGVAATEGRIVIVTTNHPEKLDPALVRAGRIDRRVYIGPLETPDVEHMFLRFYPEGRKHLPVIRKYAQLRSMTAANWQALFIRHPDGADSLVEEMLPVIEK